VVARWPAEAVHVLAHRSSSFDTSRMGVQA
jgi:hypothetical protein